MAFSKTSLLFLVVAVFFGHVAAYDNDNVDDDDDNYNWPAGVSPLDSLSYWSENDDFESEETNGCCFPRTWSGRLFTEVRREGGRAGRGRTIRFIEKTYVDQVNKRVAEDITIPHGRNATTISYIILFKNGSATFYSFSKAAKKCAKKELKGAEFRPQCIPANATRRGAFSLGAGSGALKTESWGFLYRDRRVSAASNVILTPGNCVPVIAGARIVIRPKMTMDMDDSDKKRAQVTNVGTLYTDITPSISDPSVFTPPSYCNKAEEVLTFDPDVDYTSIIERFVAVP